MAEDSNQSGREDKRLIYSTVASGASDLYKMTLTVASSFLAGSLLFLEKIAPSPTQCSKWLLGLGWLAFVAAICLVVRVQRLNLQSGTAALEGRWDDSAKIFGRADIFTALANWSLIVGMASIMLFGFLNVMQRG